MSEPPIGVAAVAEKPLAGVAASGFGRVGLAGVVLVLAAVVATMSGGAGFAGRLGTLFGFHSKQAAKPVSATQPALPAVSELRSVARGRLRHPARSAPRLRLRSRHPAATGPQRTQAPGTRPVPAAPQAPAPAPSQVPSPPTPAPAGTVHRVVTIVRDTTGPVVPPPAQPVVQPVLEQTSAAVDQVCGLAGGCP
jgi:hypothetical protein